MGGSGNDASKIIGYLGSSMNDAQFVFACYGYKVDPDGTNSASSNIDLNGGSKFSAVLYKGGPTDFTENYGSWANDIQGSPSVTSVLADFPSSAAIAVNAIVRPADIPLTVPTATVAASGGNPAYLVDLTIPITATLAYYTYDMNAWATWNDNF